MEILALIALALGVVNLLIYIKKHVQSSDCIVKIDDVTFEVKKDEEISHN